MSCPKIALHSKCKENEKKQNVDVRPLMKKTGISYTDYVKQKIFNEIKSGVHEHQTDVKIHKISRNTINSWATQDFDIF